VTFLTPRPLPDRRLPTAAGFLVVLLALPVFLAAGWELAGWALGAALWVFAELVGHLLGRRGLGPPTLSGSGVVAFGMILRGIVVMVALIVVAAFEPTLALAGALVYAAAYTTELALSLTSYYSGSAKISTPPPTPRRGHHR
jgi:hypothetical protein